MGSFFTPGRSSATTGDSRMLAISVVSGSSPSHSHEAVMPINSTHDLVPLPHGGGARPGLHQATWHQHSGGPVSWRRHRSRCSRLEASVGCVFPRSNASLSVDTSPCRESHCLAARRTARAITRTFEKKLRRPHGLRAIQFSILAAKLGSARAERLGALLPPGRRTPGNIRFASPVQDVEARTHIPGMEQGAGEACSPAKRRRNP
jgi:hypothetical protein